MDAEEELVVALITEELHRRQIEDADPVLEMALAGDADAAKAWLARTQIENDLISQVIDWEGGPEDPIRQLLSFAVTAVEMWALHTGKDPSLLVQAIVLRWSADPSS